MPIRQTKPIPSSEITDPDVFASRRRLLKGFVSALTVGAAGQTFGESASINPLSTSSASRDKPLAPTPIELVSQYNNYYEFSLDKHEVASRAQALHTEPWTIGITGMVERPVTYSMDDLQRLFPRQEYIYRLRCVEGWSVVVPWLGFPLRDLLLSVNPLSTAKYVKFTSVSQPDVMENQRKKFMLSWPYTEALRIDEATHPLTILSVGMYGKPLLKQNGAPIRLVVPWKYGFKSIKAVVNIELVESMPSTTWNLAAPSEYGFYANVNPDVPHPRWSQFSERQLGSRFYTPRRRTELFNGYGDQVASLYRDMDLRRYF